MGESFTRRLIGPTRGDAEVDSALSKVRTNCLDQLFHQSPVHGVPT